jgi:hypothetical protein
MHPVYASVDFFLQQDPMSASDTAADGPAENIFCQVVAAKVAIN